jgi:subtilisin family serine protease
MYSFKKRASIFFLIIILSQILLPVGIIKLSVSSDNALYDQNNLNSLLQENDYSSQLKSISTTQISNKNPSFDSDLQTYLKNLNRDRDSATSKEQVPIIINFKNSVAKPRRVSIIDSIFDQYELISNYDIISAVFLKVNPLELIEKQTFITQETRITKIYKSSVYSTPVITDHKLGASHLNVGSYPNWWIPAIGADALTYNGSGVSVAVLDTGIYSHPDLNIINQSDLATYGGSLGDLFGHGTHAAGIIGSSGGSSGGEYRGVAPGVSLVDAQISNSSGGIMDGDIIDAIEWASKPTYAGGAGADIISMSFGGDQFSTNPNIWNAISNVSDSYGTVFVASAGNSGPTYYTGSTPASHPDVISVGATNKNNELASFSSWGPTPTYLGYPDVVAPGVDIISTSAKNSVLEKEKRFLGDFFDFSGSADYIPLSGTSMSCPMVAGAIAILKDAYPNITATTARIALYEGATQLPTPEETYIPKSGAGLINISASLDFLDTINISQPNINNISKTFPDILPFEPFDLLNFPGDSQKFNLSVLSGMENTIELQIPTDLSGLTITTDNDKFIFSESGINFTTLTIEIDDNATIGTHNFSIGITISGKVVNHINASIKVRLPEQKILFESYHGLNDWFNPTFSFPQIGFYEAMVDIAELNISMDYSMEYWQTGYNKSLDNSILTEERLAQYDLVVLQNPILPYSPMEINNLAEYYNNGGNILYLGSRYQDVCSENINVLFSKLDLNASIKEENIISDDWIGIGTLLESLNTEPTNNSIFKNVNHSLWLYGHSFNISFPAYTIAEINSESVAFAYNESETSKGQFIAFGDLNWLYYDYTSQSNNNKQNHSLLLKNIMNYFFKEENEISINIKLNETRLDDGNLGISVYVKNITSNSLIKSSLLNSNNLTAEIINNTSSDEINLTSVNDGMAFNFTYNLSTPSPDPYTIRVNLTLGAKKYTEITKVVYFNASDVPIIEELTSSKDNVDKGSNITLEAQLDNSDYNDFQAFLSLYSYRFHNEEKTINQTHILSNGGTYQKEITIPSEPSGYGIFYVLPSNNNYTTPNSPRIEFQINNDAPDINLAQSYIRIGLSGYKRFSDTVSGNYILVQQAYQGDIVSFDVEGFDNDDSDSQLRVSVNLFLAAISEPEGGSSTIILIPPASYEEHSLTYNPSNGKHTGSFSIPYTMYFESIAGIKSISTSTGMFATDYIGLFYINVLDSEGKTMSEPFIIASTITFNYELFNYLNPEEPTNYTPIIVTLLIIGGIIGLLVLIYALRRKQISPDYSYEKHKNPFNTESEEYTKNSPDKMAQNLYYCPNCGKALDSPRYFCPRCGNKLNFKA